MTIHASDIKKAVKEALIKASTSFRSDQIALYQRAIEEEVEENSRWILEMILENAFIAEKKGLPLCDDTGIPYVLLEIGEDSNLNCKTGQIETSIFNGVAEGLKHLPGRPMAVKGNEWERLPHSKGLFEEPEMVVPSPIRIKTNNSKQLRITVLMMGGGPEIRSRTGRIFHHHDLDKIRKEMISWAKEMVGLLGCTPCVISVGIGRTHYEATCLSMDALAEATFGAENDFEVGITEAINKTGVGALGIGGRKTALGTFVKVGPQRASGVRIVNLRLGCCYDPRKASIILE
jgi:fumarate hydratase subunit alpha